MAHDIEDVLPHVAEWLNAGEDFVLASVLQTWGSSPRPVGSLMVVRQDGLFQGSVSGGCVEGAVIQAAMEHIRATSSTVLSFAVSKATAWEVGLACGGRIDVLLWPTLSDEFWSRLIDDVRHRRAPALRLDMRTHTVSLEDRDSLALVIGEEDAHRKRSGRRRHHEHEVVQHFTPKPRLLITGAVHIAQALAPMATRSGFDVMIVDPRGAFTQTARFDAQLPVYTCWPQDLHEHLTIDAQTAVVCLSHDPKIDDPALCLALDAGAFYIGALGSRKSHASRVSRLRAEFGQPPEAIDRIHGPVGIHIGSVSAAEIAVSILAEVIQTWRLPDAS